MFIEIQTILIAATEDNQQLVDLYQKDFASKIAIPKSSYDNWFNEYIELAKRLTKNIKLE